MPRKKGAKTVTFVEPPLPRLDKRAVEAVENFLLTRFGGKRPPSTAAGALALIVELHRRNIPFPTRTKLAEHIGVNSVHGLDAALRLAVARGLLEPQVEVLDRSNPANVYNLARRSYKPSRELCMQVETAVSGKLGRYAA